MKVSHCFRSLVKLSVVSLSLLVLCALPSMADGAAGETNYSFFVAGDMRNFLVGSPQKRLFDGTCDAMKPLGGAFLMSPGDCDPPAGVRKVMDEHLGPDFPWYPLAGNHDVENDKNKQWWLDRARHGIPRLVHSGPPGDEVFTYSFDYGNSHFVMLDEYFNGHSSSTKDSLSNATLKWLDADLAANHQPLIWVSGHKPIKSMPDMDTGRIRHEGESIGTNPALVNEFVALMKKYHVTAYVCGHTHDCSIAKVDGVWQLDSGHCRGAGDNGAPSTFLQIRVNGLHCAVEVYRANANGVDYKLRKTVELN